MMNRVLFTTVCVALVTPSARAQVSVSIEDSTAATQVVDGATILVDGDIINGMNWGQPPGQGAQPPPLPNVDSTNIYLYYWQSRSTSAPFGDKTLLDSARAQHVGINSPTRNIPYSGQVVGNGPGSTIPRPAGSIYLRVETYWMRGLVAFAEKDVDLVAKVNTKGP